MVAGVAGSDQRVLCDPVTVNHSGLLAALISDSDNTEEGHNYCPFFDLNRAPLLGGNAKPPSLEGGFFIHSGPVHLHLSGRSDGAYPSHKNGGKR